MEDRDVVTELPTQDSGRCARAQHERIRAAETRFGGFELLFDAAGLTAHSVKIEGRMRMHPEKAQQADWRFLCPEKQTDHEVRYTTQVFTIQHKRRML